MTARRRSGIGLKADQPRQERAPHRDPLLKLVCGRVPESDPDLASQPTFSRWKNGFSARDCYHLVVALGGVSLPERERTGVLARIVLDLDSTDDPTHGGRKGSANRSCFRQLTYPPAAALRSRDGPVHYRHPTPQLSCSGRFRTGVFLGVCHTPRSRVARSPAKQPGRPC